MPRLFDISTKMISTKYFFLLFSIFLLLSGVEVSSQSLSGANLSTINVDDLSNEAILGYIKRAQESGLTESQLEALARQRGLPESEIAKLRRRVETLRAGGASQMQEVPSSNPVRTNPIVSESEVFGILGGQAKKNLSIEERKIFGYDLFHTENLTFAPNLNIPTPEDYQLGPGDELIVDLWGATQQTLRLAVSAEGTIRPENLSPIYVNGLSIEQASDKIIHRLSQIYSGLNKSASHPPTIFYEISLGNIRTINVEIVGEVNQPGNYALSSLATVYTALHAAGGPSKNGTFRNIRLVRDNRLLSTIDIYQFLTEGIKSGDKRLKNGDVIIVKPYQTRVELQGEVKRSGLFEMKKGESFDDLLKYSGNFTNAAYKSLITVKRNGLREREILDIDADEFGAFQAKDGDVIQVGTILERFTNRVQITGAVYREGEYQLTEGLTLKALIEKADGVRGDAFLTRATIYRTNEDFSQNAIPVNLTAILNGEVPDFPLVREDLVAISSIYDLKEEFFVTISGEVSDQGVYPFFSQMTVQDLIVLAGGFKESASGSLIEISRRIKNSSLNQTAEIIKLAIDKSLSLSQEDRNRLLEPFDQVYIRKSPGYAIQQQVTVEGEVLAPGQYTISTKGERISDIIKRAGGLTPFANPEGAVLIRKTEFSSARSSDQINQEYLEQLRKKVLGDESEIKNISQTQLIERLEKIQNRITDDNQIDAIGNRFKKESIEDLTEQDTLIKDVKIADQEITVIELNKILQGGEGSKYDLLVREGDVISIPQELQTVRVTGEVVSPLNVRYDEGYGFKDYINDAGGFNTKAKKNRSYVQYPNGRRKGAGRFLFFNFYPKVEPGATIFVSAKPERKRMSLQEIIAISSSLATLALVVDRLSN